MKSLITLVFLSLLPHFSFAANWYFEFGNEGQKLVPEIEATFNKGQLKCTVEKVEMKRQGDGSFNEQRFAVCTVNDVEVAIAAGCPVKVQIPYTARAGITFKKSLTVFTLTCGP